MKHSTRQEYEERVLRVQQAIEASLDTPPAPADLARIAGLSLQHFHRVFRGLTSESMMSFSRRLRLERAARRLRTSASSVTEVALEAGYGSHEAFTRAFVARFDCTPREHRTQPSPRVFQRPLESTAALEVSVQRSAPLPMLFLRHVGDYASTGTAWMSLMRWMQTSPSAPPIPLPEMYGRSHDDPDITELTKLRYDAVILLPPGSTFTGDPSAAIAPGELLGGLYASCLHRGSYAELGQSYLRLIGHWFPSSGHIPAADPVIERYLNSPENTETADLLTQISVRVDERGWLRPPVTP